MALIQCPECKKEISDTADSCIHCGYKIPKENTISKSTRQTNSITAVIIIILIGVTVGLWVVKNLPDQKSTYYAVSNKGNRITISDFNDSRFKKAINSYSDITFSNKVTAVGSNNTIRYYIVIGWKNNSNYYYVTKMNPGSTMLLQIKYTETAYPKTKTFEEVIEKVTGFLGVKEYCTFTVSNI